MYRKLYFTFCLLLVCLIAGCTDEADPVPCVEARVVASDPCGGGFVLEISNMASDAATLIRCGNGRTQHISYVSVDNLPENLQETGTRFTCQLAEGKGEPKVCPAVFSYVVYPKVTITNVCTVPEPSIEN